MAVSILNPATWRLPGRRTTNYTNIVLTAIERAISGGEPGEVGAVEGCAGQWARGFSSAVVTPPGDPAAAAITPSMLHAIGRGLLLDGESVWYINSRNGRVFYTPAAQFNIAGEYDPQSWTYRLNLAGPSKPTPMSASQTDVLHFRINSPTERPWEGYSPLAIGERAVAEALNSYLGSELRKLNRQILLLDGFAGSPEAFQEKLFEQRQTEERTENRGELTPPSSFKATDGKVVQLGPSLDAAEVSLGSRLDNAICAACAVAPGLLFGGSTTGGTAMREDLRRLYATGIVPNVQIVEHEFRAKVNADISLDAGKPVREADAASRSRAFQAYTGGGMTIEDAARNAGVTLDSDYSGLPAPGEAIAAEPDE